jgi:hypothetical protein
MIKSVIFALTLAAVSTAAAEAQAATKQEQAACRPDAMKFCSDHVGKPAEMNACLRANKDSLSEACREVVEAHGG